MCAHLAYDRYDVWTNAGRADESEFYCLAVNVSSTRSSDLRRVLVDQGWRVDLRVPIPGRARLAAFWLTDARSDAD